jgi:chemotaxis protein methyltransferase CheR
LAPRLRDLGLASYDLYYRYLQRPEGDKELQNLINLVTVNQTSFFRGGRQFAFLREQIIPDIFRRKRRKRQIRIWCAGCSTGQEPYSLAMLVKEIAGADLGWDIKILATDVDTVTLKTAFRGVYSEDEVSPIPNTYLLKYFYKQKRENEKVFMVRDGLKEILAFRQHNLAQFPYPLKGPLDLILCRNVMIYFDVVMKEKIIKEFHRLLGSEGWLCFGFSESLLGGEDRFAFMRCAAYRKIS